MSLSAKGPVLGMKQGWSRWHPETAFLRGARPSGLLFTWLRAPLGLFVALGAAPEGSEKQSPGAIADYIKSARCIYHMV